KGERFSLWLLPVMMRLQFSACLFHFGYTAWHIRVPVLTVRMGSGGARQLAVSTTAECERSTARTFPSTKCHWIDAGIVKNAGLPCSRIAHFPSIEAEKSTFQVSSNRHRGLHETTLISGVCLPYCYQRAGPLTRL